MAKEGFSEDIPVSFDLIEVRSEKESGAVWLRYRVKKIWEKEEWIKKFGKGPKDFLAADNGTKGCK